MPQDLAHPSDAWVVLGYLQPQAPVFGAHYHGAELVAAEGLAVLAHPLLDIEHRPTVVELDGQGDEGHKGGEQGQRDETDDYVEGGFENQGDPPVYLLLLITCTKPCWLGRAGQTAV